jgi:arylsulfatase
MTDREFVIDRRSMLSNTDPERMTMSTFIRMMTMSLVVLALTHSSYAAETLPRPDPPFAGKIGFNTKESVPDWPARPTAPAGAPSVLLILLDDVGFAATSTFGGPAQTPELEKLAAEGLRYNRFHTTALCSPTRASLLSGRNEHKVGLERSPTQAADIRAMTGSGSEAPPPSRRY